MSPKPLTLQFTELNNRKYMEEIIYPILGACQCGAVSYELLTPPLKVVACHCKECQKLSTSAFSITAMVDKNSVRFHGKMNEWRRVADNGNVVAAKFCPSCSNRIYHFNPNEEGPLKLKPSNLNNTEMLEPSVHIWVSEKQNWYTLPKNAVVYQKQP